MNMEIKIKKRNGRLVNYNPNKILRRLKLKSEGLSVNYHQLSIDASQGIANGMSTIDIDNLLAETAAQRIVTDNDYNILASRICISRHHKDTPNSFLEYLGLAKRMNLINDRYYDKAIEYIDEIENLIDYSRDYKLDFFGWKTLERAYLLKYINDDKQTIVIERPQQLYMRVAVSLSETFDDIKETYELLSNQYYTHATPTLINAGTNREQLASCFLFDNYDDSIDGLLTTQSDIAKISKFGGGIGLSIHNVRAEGSVVANIGISQGILPMLRTLDDLLLWFNQLGSRKGSAAVYLEPWHKDIMVFLEIRKKYGAEKKRARDLNTAIWMPDLFMKKLRNDEDWYLFCPNEILKYNGVKLQYIYGDEFEREYDNLVQAYHRGEIDAVKTKTTTILQKMIEGQMETGQPYIVFKDRVNKLSNQKNIGTIKSSNLCAEIVEYTDDSEVSVCNLASISLPMFVDVENQTFDFEKLREVTKVVTKRLNNAIDNTFYVIDKTEISNLNNRPIAIGIQGLADTFAMLDYCYGDDASNELNQQIQENIYYAAIESSIELAQRHGTYKRYENSPLSKGIFHFEMFGIDDNELTLDWESLRKKLLEYGVYNSLFVANMPTASTSQILGNVESFECFTSNIFNRRTIAGEFQVVNKHLIKDLKYYGLWSPDIVSQIIQNGGSIQNIKLYEIWKTKHNDNKEKMLAYNNLEHIKLKYRTIWEISQKDVIDMAANRQKFVDQTQSMNLYLQKPTLSAVSSMLMYGWKKGLKTGLYYLRSKAATQANKKLGLGENDFDKYVNQSDYEECLFCGS